MIARAKGPETPKHTRQRLTDGWKKVLTLHLKNQNVFPLHIPIGKPSLKAGDLRANVAENRTWMDTWREEKPCVWQTLTHRQTGRLDYPDALEFATAHEMASWIGGGLARDLKTLESRFDDLAGIHPNLRICAKHWARILAFDATQHHGLMAFLTNHRDGEIRTDTTARAWVIAGFHSKWIETNTGFLSELISAMAASTDATMSKDTLGFLETERQILWIKPHPHDMPLPFGATHCAFPPSAITTLPAPITHGVLVENLDTFLTLHPHPGTCLLYGGGDAGPDCAARSPAIHHLVLTYWGDMDGHGYRILGRARALFPHLRSAFMGTQHVHAFAHPVDEHAKDGYTGDVPHLDADEHAAMMKLRTWRKRIEQEHLRPTPQELAAIGLHKNTTPQP